MTNEEIIKAIQALTEVVKANSGFLGSEATVNVANQKIRDLIAKLKISI